MPKIRINHACIIEGKHVPAGEEHEVPEAVAAQFRGVSAHIEVIEDAPAPADTELDEALNKAQ